MQFADQTITRSTRNYWRIVFALAAKDVVDALKNKTTLTMILGLSLMMLTVQALPLLLRLDDRPRVAIYDAARTTTADELRRDGTLQVREARRAEDAIDLARGSSAPLIAVTLPPEWKEGTEALIVDGFVGHWVRPQVAEEAAGAIERTLTAVTGRPVTIRLQTVYPTPQSGGHATMVAMGMVLATTLITTILVPYLIVEEKTTHTLDVLRASPASITQVLMGKGLAGMVYGLLAAAVLLAFNPSLVNLWGVMLTAVLGLVLFGVGLGLLVGTLVENEGSVQMWVVILTIVLMAPLVLTFFNGSRSLPGWLQQAANWLPTTAAYSLFHAAFGNVWPVEQGWLQLAAVFGAALLVFAVAGWRLRAWER